MVQQALAAISFFFRAALGRAGYRQPMPRQFLRNFPIPRRGRRIVLTLPWISASLLAAAQPEQLLVYSAGPLRLRPQLANAISFDDNVLYRPSTQAKSDFIHTISPGLEIELGTPETRYQALFDYDFLNYTYTSLSALNHQDHSLSLKASLQGDRIAASLVSAASRYTGILGGGSILNEVGSFSNLGANVNRWVFRDDLRLGYVVTEKLQAHALGHFDSIDYAGNLPLYDQNGLRGSLGASYQAFSKVSLFSETYYGQVSSTPNFETAKPPHLKQGGVFLGAKGEFTPRIQGSVQMGYEIREFGDGTDVPGVPVVLASLSYQMTEKRTASLSYTRSTGVSVENANTSFASDTILFDLSQKLGVREKWTGNLTAQYRMDNRENRAGSADGEDSYYSIGFRLSYQIQLWLSTALAYVHESYSSSVQGTVDYQVNRVTLSVSVGY